ncbi:MAG TPA: archaeosine biosynthesis radical SAM protein RaSEA [Candidatus Methanoperedens sp.]
MITRNHARQNVLYTIKELKREGLPEYDADTSRITRDTLKKMGINRAIIGLNSRGCSYANKLEGCFNCGFLKGYEHPERMFQQFLDDAGNYAGCENIFLYSNGSFFDPKEIPLDSQKKMLEFLVASGARQIVVETRPDFVNEENLNRLLETVPAKHLKVGLGFDTYNDDVRDVCLNKGYTREQYDNATRILNKYHIPFESRIIIKPPFLTEAEAVEEAIISIEYAFKKGSSEVSLEPIALQDYTLQDYLARKKSFRVPWLWSVISILKETHHMGTVLVGGEVFLPLPKETSHNCSMCTAEVRKMINKFNETQDIRLLDNLDCDCMNDWRRDMGRKEIPLFERIDDQMNGYGDR